jgi:hypothetical protein
MKLLNLMLWNSWFDLFIQFYLHLLKMFKVLIMYMMWFLL